MQPSNCLWALDRRGLALATGAKGAPPRRHPVRLMENWSLDDDGNDTTGHLAPRAAGLEKMKPAVGPDTEAWLHKFMGPLLFPALYPPTCISKIFLRPEPCKWTPASASEKGKNVVAPAAESRPFTTTSRKVHHWHKPYKHICLLRLSLPQRRSEASPTPR